MPAMPLDNPNRSGPYTRTVTGHWMHDDGSGPYGYDPGDDEFTLVVFGGDVGSVTVDNSGIHSRLGNVDSTTAAADDSSSGLNGLLKRALAHLSTLIARTPALGQQTVANSVSTALATEQAATLGSIAGISVPAHDYVALGYTGDNLTTVVYKTGGSGGTTVATLTLAYTGARLDSVTRS